jgi:hypothetical protein
MQRISMLALAAGLALLAPGAARAQTTYQIQPILKLGDMAGDVLIPPGLALAVGPLNDNGQLLIDAGTSNGSKPDLLFQYANGQFTPIMVPGREGPLGAWPDDVYAFGPLQSMNQRGNVVFTLSRSKSSRPLGTFFWDAQSQQVTSVAVEDMPAVNNLTFTGGVGYVAAINNRDEIAFVAAVEDAAGSFGHGIFVRDRNGKLLPVLLPGQELPGGAKAREDTFFEPSINDAGVVAFMARREGDKQNSAYAWEQGTITPVAVVGSDAPGGGKVTSISSVFVNNKNRSVLMTAGIDGSRRQGIYRVADGKVTPVAVPGQEMPGGGTFLSVPNIGNSGGGQIVSGAGVSVANEAGEHAFLATLDDGTSAVYKMDADGKLSLILKSRTATDLGKITNVVSSLLVSLNSKGQVALTVRIDGGPQTIVLLTPAAP